MELYWILGVVDRENGSTLLELYQAQELPLILTLPCSGTASNDLLDLYGLEATEKSLLLTVAEGNKARALLKAARRRLLIHIPGNGVLLAVPIKSVGGGRGLAYLTNNTMPNGELPPMQFEHELILVVLNQSYTDDVMDAARGAGARGGTVLHAKGTGGAYARRFLGVSIAEEREIILIAAPTEEKAAIMRAINERTGPGTPAGAVCFSMPLTMVAGLHSGEEG